MKIGIIGGGIRALACAHYLLRSGFKTVIIEEGEEIDPLGRQYQAGSEQWDTFHFSLRPSDTALRGLLAELGLQPELTWSRVDTAVVSRGRTYLVQSLEDLARIPRGSIEGTLRRTARALGPFWFTRRPLQIGLPARSWFSRRYGPASLSTTWDPLLEALLGEGAVNRVSAHRARLAIETAVCHSGSSRAELPGGFSAVGRALARSVVRRGGEIRVKQQIRQLMIDVDGRVVTIGDTPECWDGAISTLSTPSLMEILDADLARELARAVRSAPGEPLAMISALALIRSEASGPYSKLLLDPGWTFPCVIDPFQLAVDRKRPLRPIYLAHRCRPRSAFFRLPDDVLEDQARQTLCASYTELESSAIESVTVSRTDFEERRWLPGNGCQGLPVRLGCAPIYLCGEDQSPLRLPGPESSVMLARDVVGALVRDFGSQHSSGQE